MSRCVVMLVLALTPATFGCQTARKPIFPAIDPPIVWPQPPDRARIRYVGELTGEANLDIRPTGLEALKAVFAGPPATISFSTPTAVAVSGSRVFVADGQLGAVHVLDLEARTFAMITEARGEPLGNPNGLAIADGMLAVSDSVRGAVFLYEIATTTDAPEYVYTLHSVIGEGELQRPTGVAWDADAKTLWVADAAAHDCVVFLLNGAIVQRIGERGNDFGQFNFPAGIAYDSGIGALVADSMNFRVQVLDSAGAVVRSFGQKGDGAGDFSLPRAIAVDSERHVYVVDSQFENVQVFDADGQLLLAFGEEGQRPGEFSLPSGIVIDERDRIWVADTYNRRVQVFEYLSEDGPWAE